MTFSGFDPLPGQALELEPGLRLVLAPNPSPMTERGTNSWLLGDGEVAVIDPGPNDPRHLEAILSALRSGERITKILVTHAHLDHAPLAAPLSAATGAEIYAFGDASAGRSGRMVELVASGGASLGGGEGIDHAFQPDHLLADGDVLTLGQKRITALHTPGHLGNHLCFLWGDRLFSGDQVMGWAPSLVSPPDGDLTDFMASLERLSLLGPLRLYPGHGAPVHDGQARIRALYDHRKSREASILAALGSLGGNATLTALVARVYADTPPALHPAAARNLLAHLIDLEHHEMLVLEFATEGAPRAILVS